MLNGIWTSTEDYALWVVSKESSFCGDRGMLSSRMSSAQGPSLNLQPSGTARADRLHLSSSSAALTYFCWKDFTLARQISYSAAMQWAQKTNSYVKPNRCLTLVSAKLMTQTQFLLVSTNTVCKWKLDSQKGMFHDYLSMCVIAKHPKKMCLHN